jgi:hypothetical protein
MTAFILDRYGSADRVRAGDVPDPELRENDSRHMHHRVKLHDGESLWKKRRGIQLTADDRAERAGAVEAAMAPRFQGLQWGVRDRSAYRVRKTTLADEGRDPYLESLSPSARVAMVWQLTLQAWAFKEPGFREPRLRRDVVRTLRGGR